MNTLLKNIKGTLDHHSTAQSAAHKVLYCNLSDSIVIYCAV